ncbi:hypothetical protein F4824DRAFT_378207 [Ustulina deusta]|nr:hypothetical protein F4824DRAFT_378207 [Ustulina deusta]
MPPFHHFPQLPTELRLEIWRAYFQACHGTQIHIFLSAPEGPKYINQDAATGAPGYDTLAAARICADSWAVFRESFYVGDTRSLRPKARAPAARDDRYAVRFAVGADDMLYIIDSKVSAILGALSGTSWFRGGARRVALQVFNFHTPTPNPEHLPDPRPYPHNLDYWGRNWVLWNKLLSALPRDVRRVLASPSLRQLLFVVVPNREIQRTRPLEPDVYGFAVVDPESFALGSADEVHAVNGHAGLTYSRVRLAFPDLEVDRKIGYVADAVPGRAAFTCLDEMSVTGY